MRTLLTSLVVLSACQTAALPDSQRLDSALGQLDGGVWKGTLTYRDYSPPFKDVSIPAELRVTRMAGGFAFDYAYPDEPAANSKSDVILAPDGSALDGEPVAAFETGKGSTDRITTRGPCRDDERAATCEHVWEISKSRFSVRKTVMLADGAAPFRRNEYVFERASE
jgi:hypothetical protein